MESEFCKLTSFLIASCLLNEGSNNPLDVMFSNIPIILYIICSAALILYGLHHYFMLYLFIRAKKHLPNNDAVEKKYKINEDDAPLVLSQIPLYNESTVAERIIIAVAAIDYPRHRIQVLDDSDDETIGLVDAIVDELREKGVDISAVRRTDRSGFKAGALKYGMTLCDAEYITIFDSDFVPPKDFLKRTIPHFSANSRYGLVQARWDHLNAEDSAFTRAQSVGVDGHFVVEQVARSYNDYFLNFNGTAGVWKHEAIEDAGGWEADTLTEDLDLSYRAQLKGWKLHFLPDLKCPAEIPPLYRGFRSQQFRWAKGSMQTSKKMLPKIWKAKISLRKKIESTFHLTHYSLHFFMFLQAVLGLPVALIDPYVFSGGGMKWFIIPMMFAIAGPSLLYLTAELWIASNRWKHFFARLPMLLLIGFGICLSNARACIEGIIGIESPFVRTPKQGDNKEKVRYKGKKSYMPFFEIALSLYTFATALYYIHIDLALVAPFSFYMPSVLVVLD